MPTKGVGFVLGTELKDVLGTELGDELGTELKDGAVVGVELGCSLLGTDIRAPLYPSSSNMASTFPLLISASSPFMITSGSTFVDGGAAMITSTSKHVNPEIS